MVVTKSKDNAAVGPRPGRIPTRVPIKTPKKQYITFWAVKAIENPR